MATTVDNLKYEDIDGDNSSELVAFLTKTTGVRNSKVKPDDDPCNDLETNEYSEVIKREVRFYKIDKLGNSKEIEINLNKINSSDVLLHLSD